MKVKIILNEDCTKQGVLERLNGHTHGKLIWNEFDPEKFYSKRYDGNYTLFSETGFSWYIGYSNALYEGCKISIDDGDFSEPIISEVMHKENAERHCVDFINEIIDYINSKETYELDLDDIII